MKALFLLLQGLMQLKAALSAEQTVPLSCSVEEKGGSDPALKEMSFDLGDGPEKFMAYVQPDVTTFYKDIDAPASTAVNPMAGMFINMSKEPVRLFWEASVGGARSLIDVLDPFSAGGTATFPTHSFIFTALKDESKVLHRFTVGSNSNDNVYAYDPYHIEGDSKKTEDNLKRELEGEELESYRKLRKSYRFGKLYKNFTGRSYLVNYPRSQPSHFMWRADHFNQTHWITTRETHFLSMPPKEKLSRITARGRSRALREDEPRLLLEYRSSEPLLNMTLKVLSCAPRAFEIKNFLSPIEVQHMLQIASGEDLSLSQTGIGGSEDGEDAGVAGTRTSYNSWLKRERSPILDAIYRRAADLLRIDEALLRDRGDGEHPNLDSDISLAEQLQLVHYGKEQEYQAHHDFGYNSIDDPWQAQRYSTILLYLNEGMKGGATVFPRWVNAETFDALKVIPEIGKAVLFYSQLPDGNMDDLSQHEAQKLFDGEKWLTNLWVWDPAYE
eukprot:CAMPEP_0178905740 /NCGR_PEP_ID=MMETSP0786-20121207/6443_1 /TAXON_ID=186022 /ORGANISM="Thalassionema frauenfeldii, Strain CCMP 1798" /LENGTH=498 /DNA_ID=CAMNT_0020577381 /DNA_START=127 /DNA_END=1622 /DNA_ORIENTATION=-